LKHCFGIKVGKLTGPGGGGHVPINPVADGGSITSGPKGVRVMPNVTPVGEILLTIISSPSDGPTGKSNVTVDPARSSSTRYVRFETIG
jgi:hypothetical protein